jgi:alkylation response protein AidB-like acyl-CoA dehydrogenase
MKQQDIEIFIADFQQKLHTILLQNPEVETVNHPAGLSRPVLDEILCLQPLSLFIPRIYGGRAGSPHHCLSLLEAAGYESLAVSLMLGINGALFLEPLNKYGQQETKTKVYQSFVEKHAVGGLMITEPGFGTDALSMTTSYTLSEKGYHIKGSKHWGGLTGLADFWLVTARKEKTTNRLARDIDLFVVDQSKAEQRIEVKEYFHKLGLFLIPYGLNSIDLTAPTDSRLVPATSGVKMLMDLLHRSRLRISGIGMGFITRILDEAIKHCQQRYVGKKSLLKYDQVQQRLSQLQAWYTINSAICLYAAKVSGVDNDLTLYNLEANSAKAVVTDMMQDAAQSLLQLTGAKGYRRDHIAGRGVTDSRPFQIFEGSNDVMYIQVADAFIKEMIKTKETDLYSFASRFSTDQQNRRTVSAAAVYQARSAVATTQQTTSWKNSGQADYRRNELRPAGWRIPPGSDRKCPKDSGKLSCGRTGFAQRLFKGKSYRRVQRGRRLGICCKEAVRDLIIIPGQPPGECYSQSETEKPIPIALE